MRNNQKLIQSQLLLTLWILLILLISACSPTSKMVSRYSSETATKTPFLPKATFTIMVTPANQESQEDSTDLAMTITLDPTLVDQTSEADIGGDGSLTPQVTNTPEQSPTVQTWTLTPVTPSASPTPFTPSMTSTPVLPSATVASMTPPASLIPGAPTYTILPPTATLPDTATAIPTDTPPPSNTQEPTSASEPTNTAYPAGCAPSGNNSYENQVITLINQERADRGLSTLGNSSSLRQAARRHSEDMACNDFFSHTGSDGSSLSSRVLSAGYGFSWVAENIAASSSCGFSASSVVSMWMNSSGHRKNMLSENAVHIGVGFRCVIDSTTGDLDAYYTADFGRP